MDSFFIPFQSISTLLRGGASPVVPPPVLQLLASFPKAPDLPSIMCLMNDVKQQKASRLLVFRMPSVQIVGDLLLLLLLPLFIASCSIRQTAVDLVARDNQLWLELWAQPVILVMIRRIVWERPSSDCLHDMKSMLD
ncbi:hypothetical protein EYF80_062892 [Liparis tanakae]|uniref:Uncharacterized protein n=1 Tax=Liparis tanakae TaxID=230148 RepID=A0A4Z2EDK7_9TELE|nr:hypothetical protein EYF80_062892 [Liparis tanakae]